MLDDMMITKLSDKLKPTIDSAIKTRINEINPYPAMLLTAKMPWKLGCFGEKPPILRFLAYIMIFP